MSDVCLAQGVALSPCAVDGCVNAASKGQYCWGHYKRTQRGQLINAPLEVPKQKRNTREAVVEAMHRYVDADSDGDFSLTERRLFETIHNYARRHTSEKIRDGLARRRAAGLPVGRPSAPVPESDLELLRLGEARVKDIAAKHGVSRMTLWSRVKKT